MKTLAAAVMASLILYSQAPAAQEVRVALTNAPAPAVRAAASKVCATGERSLLFVHPADACWTSFTLSLKENDAAAALQSVRHGCEKYGRGDHCMFLKATGPSSAAPVQINAQGTSRYVADGLRRAAASVDPVDIVDAELGADLRRLPNR